MNDLERERREAALLYAYGTVSPPLEIRSQFDDQRKMDFESGAEYGEARSQERIKILEGSLRRHKRADLASEARGFARAVELLENFAVDSPMTEAKGWAEWLLEQNK